MFCTTCGPPLASSHAPNTLKQLQMRSEQIHSKTTARTQQDGQVWLLHKVHNQQPLLLKESHSVTAVQAPRSQPPLLRHRLAPPAQPDAPLLLLRPQQQQLPLAVECRGPVPQRAQAPVPRRRDLALPPHQAAQSRLQATPTPRRQAPRLPLRRRWDRPGPGRARPPRRPLSRAAPQAPAACSAPGARAPGRRRGQQGEQARARPPQRRPRRAPGEILAARRQLQWRRRAAACAPAPGAGAPAPPAKYAVG